MLGGTPSDSFAAVHARGLDLPLLIRPSPDNSVCRRPWCDGVPDLSELCPDSARGGQ